MRKKGLVLLLTLSLVLSYMPMIAFADTEAEGSEPVNETVEAEKAEPEEPLQNDVEAKEAEVPAVEAAAEEESAEDASQQTVKEESLNEEPECTHENTYTKYEEKNEYIEIEGNNKYHLRVYTKDEVEYCEDCGIEIPDTRISIEISKDNEYHDYDSNNFCTKCEHMCEHKYKKQEFKWNEDVSFASENNAYHSVTGSGVLTTSCEDCSKVFASEEVETFYDEEQHEYNSEHICIDCGHKNTCKHSSASTRRILDHNDIKPTPVNNIYHLFTGPGEISMQCEYCGETFKREKVDNINEEKYHRYNSEHVCIDCGHKNTCNRTSKYYDYHYVPEKCIIEDTGDGYHHKVTGRITKSTYCKTCEEELIKDEDLGYTTVDEIHYYEDNVCKYCGYHKPDIRLFGALRYDTAIEAAEKYKGSANMFENVIVAYGRNFPDALSGGYLAKVKNAPILLVEPSEESRMVDYISSKIASGGTVYILGGTGVVSSEFQIALNEEEINTIRLGGINRYETNLLILKEAGVMDEDILVCTGKDYADSLSASAVGKPILLVGNTLTDEQKEYIEGLSTTEFYLIGGEGAVSLAIDEGLQKLGFTPRRLWGQTRYETSAEVAKAFFAKAATVVLAYAQNFPDGLSGGPLAMVKNAPIILTISNNTKAAESYVKGAGVAESITLGGPALISDIAVKTIMGR